MVGTSRRGLQGVEDIASFSLGGSAFLSVLLYKSDLTITLPPLPGRHSNCGQPSTFTKLHVLSCTPSEEPRGHFCLFRDRDKLKNLLKWIELVFGISHPLSLLGGGRVYCRDSPISVTSRLPLWILTFLHTTCIIVFLIFLEIYLNYFCLPSSVMFINEIRGLLCILYFSNIH